MRHIILHEWCCFLQNQSHCFKMERLEALIINKKNLEKAVGERSW